MALGIEELPPHIHVHITVPSTPCAEFEHPRVPKPSWNETLASFTVSHMTVTLPDDPALVDLDETQLKIDLACTLFAAGRISRTVAARISGLNTLEFDEALFERKIPTYTSEMLDQDLSAWHDLVSE